MASYNYYKLIRHSLDLQDLWVYVTDSKFDRLKEALLSSEFDANDEDWEIQPTNKTIASLLNLNQSKVNKLIREFYFKLSTYFHYGQITLDEYFHVIILSPPMDETIVSTGKRWKFKDDERSLTVRMKLPVTPRVGECIRIEFNENDKYSMGYVYDVQHDLSGYRQKILVFAHPRKNPYENWVKMKERYQMHRK